MSFASRVIGSSRSEGEQPYYGDTEFLEQGTGLVIRMSHPPPTVGKDPSLSMMKMVSCMNDGKTTICILLSMAPHYMPEKFPGINKFTYVIIWSEDIGWALSYFKRLCKLHAKLGLPPIRKVCFVIDDAMKKQRASLTTEAKEKEARTATIRHDGVGDVQHDVGWGRGGSITLMINVQYVKGINPFLRSNSQMSFAYAFSNDISERKEIIKDMTDSNPPRLFKRVMKWLEDHTRRKMLGDLTSNSEALVKFRSGDVAVVDFRRIYKLLDAEGLMDLDELVRRGIVHRVTYDPELEDVDPLEWLAQVVGERTEWTDDKKRLTVEVRAISRDEDEPERLREIAKKAKKEEFRDVYFVRRERELEEVEEPDPNERRIALFHWVFGTGKLEYSTKGDKASGHHPQTILDVFTLARGEVMDEKTGTVFGDWVKDLWRDDKELTEWLRKNKTYFEAATNMKIKHDRYEKKSSWYFFKKPKLSESSTYIADSPILTEESSVRM